MLVLATQTGHALHQLLRIPHLDLLHADACLDLFATQAGWHRIGLVFDPDRAATPHTHTFAFQGLDATARQRPQVTHLHADLGGSTGIPQLHHRRHQLPILRSISKIPTATQQQRLLHRRFEMPMRRLHIAILMAAGWIGRFGLHAIVSQQGTVLGGKLFCLAVVMNRQSHAIGPVPLGHGAQRPQGVLQSRAQTGEILAQTQREVFPVRMGQHEVIGQVRPRDTGYRHLQFVHRREVGSRQSAWFMHLGEEYLLG